ncbi:MAG: penicillin-binding transpeptidase domain-containing protein [Actinomycetota bacterium]|nr:penicillin-binding transpeptidase domain-containing protein [Actinomycetota bacterium]
MPRLLTAGVATAVVLGLAACTDGADPAADVQVLVADYLQAWMNGEYAAAAAATDDPAGTETLFTDAAEWVGVPGPVGEVGEVTVDEETAGVTVDLRWEPPGLPAWAYDGALDLALDADGEWQIQAGPALVHPALADGERLLLTRTLPERASILDAAGTPLFTATPIVTVGIDPANVTDLPSLATTLAGVLAVDAAQVSADVQAAAAGQFVPVITLRRADYDAVRDQIYDLPGTVFQEATRQLAPSARFASAVLGRVGPVTEEVVEESGGRLRAGDEAGLSGLQRGYQEQLTGTPGLTVSTARDDLPVEQLTVIDPVPGEPLRTTLSTEAQAAADAAVAGQELPAYVVAVRPSTGEILAVAANEAANPANALVGQYPAGSTFKIVVAAAVLSAGLAEPATVLPCPATNTVEGREFENADRFALGEVSFTTAFARSCNSTFTALGVRLPPEAFPETAAAFGIGSDWNLPVDTVTGSVVAPESAVRQAEDSIGQGDVLVSPFSMALAAGTVVQGATPVPVLVPAAEPAGPAPPTLDPAVADALRALTRAVVTDGTATVLADLPGQVGGKTGTAEYGTGDPPPAHAWFAGYRGDLAFSAFVEGGQSSTVTAVPLAEAFLSLTA